MLGFMLDLRGVIVSKIDIAFVFKERVVVLLERIKQEQDELNIRNFGIEGGKCYESGIEFKEWRRDFRQGELGIVLRRRWRWSWVLSELGI